MTRQNKLLRILNYTLAPICAALFAVFFILIIKSAVELDANLSVNALPMDEGAYDEAPGKLDKDIFVPAKGITFDTSKYIRIIPGGTYQINWSLTPDESFESLYWYSTKTRYATVSQDGMITGLEKGEAVIFAETYDRSVRQNVVVSVIDMPKRILNVPYINQLRDYPNGCESCSTVMALNHVGIDISVDEFIENYLDMCEVPYYDKNGRYVGHTPWEYFLGDPRLSTGLCCYAPVIMNALEKFVDPDAYLVEEHYGESLDALCRDYINNGVPIIFWGTMYMKNPYLMNWTWHVLRGDEDETFTWVAPMHCLLLVGYDDEYYYFNDPVAGKGVAYSKEDTELAYEGLYMQAVTVSRRSDSRSEITG